MKSAEPHLQQKQKFAYILESNYLAPYTDLELRSFTRPRSSEVSSLNHFYSPNFSFMHNVPTDFRIIMNPANLESSMSFYRLSFELQLEALTLNDIFLNLSALGDAEAQ